MASELEPGDDVVFYVTGVQAFGAIARVRSPMFEDRTPIWPARGRKPDAYPWRVDAEPLIVLEEGDFVLAEELAGDLEHVRKWPPEHWQLAFQGQLPSMLVRLGGEHGELLATQARDDVAGPRRPSQGLGELDQGAVARGVPESIVELLEPIQVEHHDRQRPPAAGRALELAGEPTLELPAVCEPGQRVRAGSGAQLGQHPLHLARSATIRMPTTNSGPVATAHFSAGTATSVLASRTIP